MYKKKVTLRDAIFAIIQGTFPNSGLYIVGSSVTGFSTMKSDMDLCLVIYDSEISKDFASAILTLVKKSLGLCKFVRRLIIIPAVVPILRFKDTISNIECDINVNNVAGVRNTHLLKYYSLLDWRVRILTLFVKHWAKFHNINDARNMTISSYNLTLMIIFYLQNCNPPVLPSLQKLYPDKFDGKIDISKLRLDHKLEFKSENKDTVGDLFCGFLKFYAETFSFENEVISVRLGVSIPKKRIQRQFERNLRDNWANPLCIEEPFMLCNAARACYDRTVFSRVQGVFKTSHKRMSIKPNMNNLFLSFEKQ